MAARKGEEHPEHKLTRTQAKYIRDTYDTSDRKYGLISFLARKHGVSPVTVFMICRRQTWTCLDEDYDDKENARSVGQSGRAQRHSGSAAV